MWQHKIAFGSITQNTLNVGYAFLSDEGRYLPWLNKNNEYYQIQIFIHHGWRKF